MAVHGDETNRSQNPHFDLIPGERPAINKIFKKVKKSFFIRYRFLLFLTATNFSKNVRLIVDPKIFFHVLFIQRFSRVLYFNLQLSEGCQAQLTSKIVFHISLIYFCIGYSHSLTTFSKDVSPSWPHNFVGFMLISSLTTLLDGRAAEWTSQICIPISLIYRYTRFPHLYLLLVQRMPELVHFINLTLKINSWTLWSTSQ